MGGKDSGSRELSGQRRQTAEQSSGDRSRGRDAVHEQPGIERHELPGTIPVEEYHSYFHADRWTGQGNPLSDGTDVDWLGSDEWLTYDVDVRESGPYDVTARVAAADSFGPGSFGLAVDGTTVERIRFDPTGGWHSWAEIERRVELPRGLHTVGIVVREGGWKLEWLRFE